MFSRNTKSSALTRDSPDGDRWIRLVIWSMCTFRRRRNYYFFSASDARCCCRCCWTLYLTNKTISASAFLQLDVNQICFSGARARSGDTYISPSVFEIGNDLFLRVFSDSKKSNNIRSEILPENLMKYFSLGPISI
jgi:hypothetical protein